MVKQSKQHGSGRTIRLVLLGLVGLGLLIAALLRGRDLALFRPQGAIAGEQFRLMLFSAAVLLAVAIPTLFLFYFFAWKYRESNKKALHNPRIHHSKFLVVNIWLVPSLVMLTLASVMWPATHKLAPQKLIASDVQPLTIQVIALPWKWLFIYPEQNIATINFLQVPVNTPLQFDLTADETPMSSFWIPHLGGQLYAMTGMVNRLNLMADTPGDYMGRSAELNGAGFSSMQFRTRVSSRVDFETWALGVEVSRNFLDAASYQKLLLPSENNSAAYYNGVEPNLYATALSKYNGSMGMSMNMGQQ